MKIALAPLPSHGEPSVSSRPSNSPGVSPAHAPPKTSLPPLIRLFLVGNDPARYQILRELLHQKPAPDNSGAPGEVAPRFCLEHVVDYDAGLEAIAQTAHEVALVDLTSHGQRGLEFAREARARGARVPLVLLGEVEAPDLSVEAVGAVACLGQGDMDFESLALTIMRALRDSLAAQTARAAALPNVPQDVETILFHYARLEAAVDQAELGVIMAHHSKQEDGIVSARITHVNAAFERITGYSKGEVVGRNADFLQGHNSDALAVAALRAAVAAGEPHQVTILNYRKDGTPFWNALQISPVRDAGGVITDWVGIISDVSDRIEAERALRHSEESLAAAQKLTHLGSWVLDLSAQRPEAERLTWSDEAFRILGLEPGSVTPSREFYRTLIHPDDCEKALLLEDVIAQGTGLDVQYRVIRPDGQERTVQVRAEIERDSDGTPRRAIGTILDISERWRAESRAREARRYLRWVMQNAPVVIWALDSHGLVTFVEGQAVQGLEDMAKNHVGCSIFEIYRDYPAIQDLARRALGGEETTEIIEVNTRCFDVKYTPLRDESGAGCGAVGLAYDITERRSVERALWNSEERLHTVIDSVPMLIWAVDREGVFTLSEGRALDLMGIKQGEAIGQSLFSIYGEEAPISAKVRRALSGESGQGLFEVAARILEVHYGPSHDEGGAIVGAVGVAYDVSERVRVQRELEQSEARFNRIVANAPGMVYSFRRDREGQISFLFVSDGCREIYGLEADFIQQNPNSLIDVVFPDDSTAFQASILDSERDLAPWHWEGRIERPDGEPRWVRGQSRPVRQSDGSTVWDGLVMDVTQTRTAQEGILKSRRALDEAQQLAHIGSFEWNLESGEICWSDEMFRIFGFEPQSFALTPASLIDLIAAPERESVRGRAMQSIDTASPESMVVSVTRADGTTRFLQTHTRTEVDEAGRSLTIVGSAQDITENLEASHALRQSEQRYALAAQGANDGLWDWNLDAGQIYFSPRWKTMLGYTEGEIGDDPNEWLGRVHEEDFERLRTSLTQHLAGETAHLECEYRVHCADGQARWMLCRALAVIGAGGAPERIAGSQTDITERKTAEAELSRNAFYDKLTGLPNRALLLERLERTLTRARRNSEYAFATLFLDLDRFKKINDTLGHMAGDQLLVEASARFASCLRPGDTVARLGGDEFAILIDDIHDPGDVPLVAGRIQEELERPFLLEGKEIFVTVSIGIAPYHGGEETPDDLLRNADSAMYRAKGLGRARFETFDAEMHQRALHLLELETDLWRAIERRELRLHYQPIVSLQSGLICGYEALVRWNHPTRGLVPPGDFISIAEENGFIMPLGWWVLEEACRQSKVWSEARAARFPDDPAHFMTINLSSQQFSQDDMIDQVCCIVEKTGADPHQIILEITESIIMEHSESASETLRALKAMGIRLSMDDFGTGYSSLSYLHRFPLDILKIDRSFVSQMRVGARDGEIVNTILTLASGLNMKVVAEGVETDEQLAALRRMGCGFAQGYLLARPLESHGIETLWERAPRW